MDGKSAIRDRDGQQHQKRKDQHDGRDDKRVDVFPDFDMLKDGRRQRTRVSGNRPSDHEHDPDADPQCVQLQSGKAPMCALR